ncbi:PREDICTED: double-stranded RNA-binding protein 1-like [Nelumbo nucifera]|uniref:Double-stranded RNA-binding protein 1-like n=1 Tax=Nelumbo nucifera TaxID=4432 RepID=A0A1U7Z7Y1_NELNU|nr:PREDICTED: double-stranded RNA-binding protein 1-like [Nelumbo nucifera]
MHKSKLQELCQRKTWSLPKYTWTKEGPDHNPCFKASVFVNGISFDTSNSSRSSKEAQNEAAKIALDYFCTSARPPPDDNQSVGDSTSNPSVSAGYSSARTELQSNSGIGGRLSPKNSITGGNMLSVKNDKEFGDMQHLYKNQLQSYAQRKSTALPTYSYVNEGLPHDPRFKAKVTINGQIFESPGVFCTVKEAENAAAGAACASLSLDDIQLDEYGIYKNLLQELMQKEGFSMPIYNTTRSGASHLPTFFSSVEIEKEIFQGEAAKTKKQAEMNAAKVAYFVLKERGDQDANLAERISANAKDGTRHSMLPSGHANDSTPKSKKLPCSSDDIYAHLRDPFPSICSSSDDDFSSDGPCSPKLSSGGSECLNVGTSVSAVDSNIKVVANERPQLSKRIRVYPRKPDMTFPRGVTILPISDDKWVALSLDFPKEDNQHGEALISR